MFSFSRLGILHLLFSCSRLRILHLYVANSIQQITIWQVGEVSKRSSEKWKRLTPDQKRIWEDEARADKERYNIEKERYTGPWQVKWKRAKKNPDAPKRPMSAFLYYSQEKRSSAKEQHPGLKNTDISRLLGHMWKKASPEERTPHIEREKEQRGKYKISMADWKEKEEKRKSEQQKKDEEELQSKAVKPNSSEYDIRPEPLPYSAVTTSWNHSPPASSGQYYKGEYNGMYHGYYPQNYGNGSYDGYAQYPPPRYSRYPEDRRYGYYNNDDLKPIPFKPQAEDIYDNDRYARSDSPPYSTEQGWVTTPIPTQSFDTEAFFGSMF